MDVEVQLGRLVVHLVPETVQHTGVSAGQRQRFGEPSLEPAYEERSQYSEEAAVHSGKAAIDHEESVVVPSVVHSTVVEVHR